MQAGQLTQSVTPAEIARFDALAAEWWDPNGPMRPLHRMNKLRTEWIGERIVRRFGRSGVALLDIGCGAGIAAEAFARQGYDVLGLDAAGTVIAAARSHAASGEWRLAYREGTAEELRAEGRRFPVITALEVIEHVADQPAFLRLLADLLEPGGVLFLSTLNRTPRSFMFAKLGAEYLLRWLPVGTHDWRRFVTPAELGAMARAAGLRLSDAAGMTADPLRGRWIVSRDLAVNYIAAMASPSPLEAPLKGEGAATKFGPSPAE